MLEVGDPVRKRSGYKYPGVVVAVFTTRAGLVRYVVEADHPSFSGMLHIFAEDQLGLRCDEVQRLVSAPNDNRAGDAETIAE
jgi:hypothetical protein